MPDTEQLLLRVPPELKQALKTVAFFTDRSMNEIAVTALAAYLSDNPALEAILDKAEVEQRGILDKLKEL